MTIPLRNRGQLRADVFAALGFIDPFASVQTRTLAQMQTDLMLRLGYAVQASSPPPGMADLLAEFLNEAQATLWRRYEAGKVGVAFPTRMSASTDVPTLDYVPVQTLALGLVKAHYGKPDAKLHLDQVERYMAEIERHTPANATTVVNQLLESAHRTLYRRYNVLRDEKFFTWTLVAAQNLYELDENDEQAAGPSQCLDVIDPREVTWAGIERDGLWYPLICGIPPECYSNNAWSAWPSRYEIRECIELWPSPGTEVQKLRLKAHAQLNEFDSDDDFPSIDDEPLYLLACAEAKQFYKQPDAQIYVAKLEAYIRNLTAGSHQTRRYVPGVERRAQYVEPSPTVPFA